MGRCQEPFFADDGRSAFERQAVLETDLRTNRLAIVFLIFLTYDVRVLSGGGVGSVYDALDGRVTFFFL